MGSAEKSTRVWKRLWVTRSAVVILAMLTAFVTAPVADAYVVSGTVTNNSGKSGRTYLFVNASAGYGTSIDSSGSFSISGVSSGTYTITAVMDTRGDGRLFATDPTGTSASFTVTSADMSGVTLTLANPAAPPPPTPSWLIVYPGDGSAAVRWDIQAKSHPYLPIADHYNLYWSTSPNVSPTNTTGGGSKVGISHPGYGWFSQTGLSNGSIFYYVVTATVNGMEGQPSPVYGPVSIGPPAKTGGVTVEGSVSMAGITPTGPLHVSLWDGSRLIFQSFASPTTTQAFRFNNVPDGFYYVFAGLDSNDSSDDTRGLGNEFVAPTIIVQGAPLAGVTVPLSARNGDAGVFTEFVYPNRYTLFFEAKNNQKTITNMTVTSGPNLSQPLDVPWDDGYFDTWSFDLPGRPNVGDTYNVNLRYADGTSESHSVAITDILDGYVTPLSPSGTIAGTTPLMTWTLPSSLPAQTPFLYYVNVYTPSRSRTWKNNIPSNRTYAAYNEDGTAQPLVGGTQYSWHVEVKDQHGNRSTGPEVLFTPTATSSKQLTVISRNPANGIS